MQAMTKKYVGAWNFGPNKKEFKKLKDVVQFSGTNSKSKNYL